MWIAENIHRKLPVRMLADRLSMSGRNFQRIFTREVGQTPSRYILQSRVEAARRQLELTDRRMKAVALAVGFSSVDLMRRAFVRILGINPRRYCEAIVAGEQASQLKSPVRGPFAAGSSLMR